MVKSNTRDVTRCVALHLLVKTAFIRLIRMNYESLRNAIRAIRDYAKTRVMYVSHNRKYSYILH